MEMPCHTTDSDSNRNTVRNKAQIVQILRQRQTDRHKRQDNTRWEMWDEIRWEITTDVVFWDEMRDKDKTKRDEMRWNGIRDDARQDKRSDQVRQKTRWDSTRWDWEWEMRLGEKWQQTICLFLDETGDKDMTRWHDMTCDKRWCKTW